MIELAPISDSAKLQSCLSDLLAINGALVVGLGSWKTNACIAYDGIDSPAFPNAKIPVAVAGNAKVIQAKMSVAQALQFNDNIQDILISLTTQWHLIRLLSTEGLFLYFAMDRTKSNIASAHLKLLAADRIVKELRIQV